MIKLDKIIKYETNENKFEIMFNDFDNRISYISINKDSNREIHLINSDIKGIKEILEMFNFLKL